MSTLLSAATDSKLFIVIDKNGNLKTVSGIHEVKPGEVILTKGDDPILTDEAIKVEFITDDGESTQIDVLDEVDQILAQLEQGQDPTQLGDEFAPAAGGTQGSSSTPMAILSRDGVEVLASTSFDTQGLESQGLSRTQAVTLLQQIINQPPTVSLTNIVTDLDENSNTDSSTKIADIEITDDALGINTLTLSGTDADNFIIVENSDGSFELHLKAGVVLDHEALASMDVSVNVSDASLSDSPLDTASTTLAVNDVNEAPTVALSNVVTNIDENSNTDSSTKIADIEITDDALGINTLTLSGTDADNFIIVENSDGSFELHLKAGVVLDHEALASMDVSVNVSDASLSDSPLDTASTTLAVNDVNEAPTVALSNVVTNIDENSNTDSSTKIADIEITDDALGINTLTLSGTDADNFIIVENSDGSFELHLKAGVVLDHEALASMDVSVNVSDASLSDSPLDTASTTLAVNDVNEAPTVALSNVVTNIDENSNTDSSTKIADIEISDDALGINTLTLSGTDADNFIIVENSDGSFELHLKAGVVLDHEALASMDVSVNVSDASLSDSPLDTASTTLAVNDVNEAPTVALSNVVTNIDENSNTDSSTKIADIEITDDALGINTLTLSGTDADNFIIVENSDGSFELHLKAGVVLDHEALASMDVSVNVSDASLSDSPLDTASTTLAVNDVNEAPAVALRNVVTNIDENSNTDSSTKIADIEITDDALGINTLTLSGTDADNFIIVENSDGSFELHLKAGVVLDHEALASMDVSVNVSDASLSDSPLDTASTTLAVNDVNEAPTAESSTVAVNEDEYYNFSASDFSFSDIDEGDTLSSVTITSLPDNGELFLYDEVANTYTPVTQDDVILAENIGSLVYIANKNESGESYANIGFTVSDGELASAEHTIQLNILPVADPVTLSVDLSPSINASIDFQATDLSNRSWTSQGTGTDYNTDSSGVVWGTNNSDGKFEVGKASVYGAGSSDNQIMELEGDRNDTSFTATLSENAEAGDVLTIDFDIAARRLNSDSDSDATLTLVYRNENGEQVEQLLFVYDPTSTNNWSNESITFQLPEGQEGSYQLVFESSDLNSADTYGALLDNISIVSEVNTGYEGSVINLSPINAALNDTDGSESLRVELVANSDALNGVTVTDGVNSVVFENGVADISDLDLSNLQVLVPSDSAGTYELVLNAYSVESDNSTGPVVSTTLDITVLESNTAPLFSQTSFSETYAENSAAGTILANVGTTDIDGDAVTYAISNGNSNGWFAIDNSGNITLTDAGALAAANNFEDGVNTHTLLVTATDARGLVSQTSVSLTEVDVNEAPNAQNASILVNEDEYFTFSASDFGFSDIDEGDTLSSVTITSLPAKGGLYLYDEATDTYTPVAKDDVILAENIGSLVYIANENESGDSYANIGFTVSDGELSSAEQTISVDVTPVADAGVVTVNPITQDDTINLAESQTSADAQSPIFVSGTAIGGDISEGDRVTMIINDTTYETTVGENGVWQVAVNGSDLAADTSFDVVVTSFDGESSVESVGQSQHMVDTSAPLVSDLTIDANATFTFDAGQSGTSQNYVSDLDDDLSGTPVGIEIVSGPRYGQLIDASGTPVSYDTPTVLEGTELSSFTYQQFSAEVITDMLSFSAQDYQSQVGGSQLVIPQTQVTIKAQTYSGDNGPTIGAQLADAQLSYDAGSKSKPELGFGVNGNEIDINGNEFISVNYESANAAITSAQLNFGSVWGHFDKDNNKADAQIEVIAIDTDGNEHRYLFDDDTNDTVYDGSGNFSVVLNAPDGVAFEEFRIFVSQGDEDSAKSKLNSNIVLQGIDVISATISDSFTYEAEDSAGNRSSEQATVTISETAITTVVDVNNAPTVDVEPTNYSIGEEGAVEGAILFTFDRQLTDSDGDALSYSLLDDNNGHLALEIGIDGQPTGNIVLTELGATAINSASVSLTNLSVTIQVDDGQNENNSTASDSATLTLNYAPVANDDQTSSAFSSGLIGETESASASSNWGHNVNAFTIEAFNSKGEQTDVAYYDNYQRATTSNSATRIGVAEAAGGYAKQIEYDRTEGASEKISINLESAANQGSFRVSNLFENEQGYSEQGKWTAYLNGVEVASALFHQTQNGTGTFSIDTNGLYFDQIVFEATEYRGLEGEGSGRDSSDYFLTGVSFSSSTSYALNEGESEDASGNVSKSDNGSTIFSIKVSDLLSNDSDVETENESLYIKLDANGDGEEETYGYNDTFSYHVPEGTNGEVIFSYTVYDEAGASDSANVALYVNPESALTYVEVGSDTDDVLVGGVGSDILTGGLGDDILTGGDGKDIFVWNSTTVDAGTDRIRDFNVNEDTLDFGDLLDDVDANSLDGLLASITVENEDLVLTMKEGAAGQTIVIEGVATESNFSDLSNITSNDLITTLFQDHKLTND